MTKRNVTWWNPLTWMAGKAAAPLRPPISIDERQMAIAKPGDLVMVTLPDAIKPNERDHFLAYVGQIAKDHGVRLWILDGGFGVTVVPHGDPRNMTATESRMRDIARDEVWRERGRLASSRRERGGQ